MQFKGASKESNALRFDIGAFMSRKISLFGKSRQALIGGILFAGVASLSACSEKPQSLAEYIRAICAAPFRSASAEEAPYLAENISAMTKMMIDMGIQPSGDVDSDFVSMMVPHHQGAIEMAQALLRYGRNEKLKRIAQEIIITQQQEIAALRLAVGQPNSRATLPLDQPLTTAQVEPKSGPSDSSGALK